MQEDCMLNMTLDLPPFEGGATPGCPGKGWLDTPPPNASTPQLQECPVINSTFIKSG
jgi:hypothetical protein